MRFTVLFFRYCVLFIFALIFVIGDVMAQDEDSSDTVVITGKAIEEPDSIEEVNRSLFGFNQTIDDAVLAPFARGYRAVVPQWGRNRISSVVSNINEPVVFINSIAQGKSEKAFTSFWRFVINSTFGIGGMLDIAGAAGLEPVKEDFGQTMAVWGHKKSNYFVIPFIGSSTNRDTAGLVVDTLTNPFTYVGFPLIAVIQGTKVVSKREAMLDFTDDVEKNSFDPYATMRSSYFQHREENIKK